MTAGRRTVGAGSLCWAFVGAAVALAALPTVNDDARFFVAVASVLFPLCAVGAAWSLWRGNDRGAGLLLLASSATPTYFAFVLNIPVIVIGVLLLIAPPLIVGRTVAA
ncbi:MAG: hypothetical protein M3445_02140 [Actinomycetota bacterium]|nr:hypothetical protein [Actinomycetota bacterium]